MVLIPQHVYYMPKELESGIHYISKEFKVAIHLCACGCGEKTVTPFDKSYGWTLTEVDGKITLDPSIGNFQLPCKSHYYIRNNEVIWC